MNIAQLNIRDAVLSDSPSLAVLESQLSYPMEESLVRERMKELTEAGDRILVAEFNDNVIGMIVLHRTYFLHRPPDGRVSTLAVLEGYRNYGVGKKLLEKAESVFRNLGCGRVEVTSGGQRDDAHRFYIREGYTEYPKRFRKVLVEGAR